MDQVWLWNVLTQCLTFYFGQWGAPRSPHSYLWDSAGDPPSPHMFIMCAEALSAMLQTTKRSGEIIGVPIARERVRLNHLFFADYSLLFCKVNVSEWQRLQNVLSWYERASRQRLNKEKTSIYFSCNTKDAIKRKILLDSGIEVTNSIEKYWGVPALVGRSIRMAFMSVKDRIWSRIFNSKNKFLSQAGK
jgi:hypothetical protein